MQFFVMMKLKNIFLTISSQLLSYFEHQKVIPVLDYLIIAQLSI